MAGEKSSRFWFMVGLILAGESVFFLPFHVTRFFRADFQEVFGFTGTELGTVMGFYGVTAMAAYLIGGPIADRFPARKMLALSLSATALGGLYMATIPGYRGACALWAYFGVSTLLLFWSPLLRATRYWGSALSQGRAYGILDGGRGAIAVLLALLAAVGLVPSSDAASTLESRRQAVQLVICGYSLLTFAAAAFVWFVVPETENQSSDQAKTRRESVWHHVWRAIRIPAIWVQTAIVICAYVSFKGFDNLGLYSEQAFALPRQSATWLIIAVGAVRPVASVAAGFWGDRFRSSRVVVIAFSMMVASHAYFAFVDPVPGTWFVLAANAIFGATATFGIRGIYFALFGEAKVPTELTGTAVGLVSVVGYTPDVFVNYVQGLCLDGAPGAAGHQYFYMFQGGFALLGLLMSLLFTVIVKRPGAPA